MRSMSSALLMLFLAYTIPLSNGQCPDCDAVSPILASCNLPPLDRDWRAVEQSQNGTVLRNLTGNAIIAELDAGPDTVQLSSYAQAKCLCPKAIKHLNLCSNCIEESTDDFDATNMPLEGSKVYFHDCTAFGYFANDTLGAPSSTATAAPIATSLATVPAGCDVCGVLEGQLKQCGLLPLNTSAADRPKGGGFTVIHSDADNTDYYARLLFNRTAADCLCTLPVLRRFKACRYCVQGLVQMDVLDDYHFDCEDMGYWSDDQPVDSEQKPKSSGSSSSSSSSSSSVAPASTGNARSEGGSVRVDRVKQLGSGLMLLAMGMW